MWFKLAGADFSKNNLGTMSSISSSYLIDYTGLTGMSGSPSSVSYAGSSAGTSKTASVVVTVTSGYTLKQGSTITASGGKSGTVFTADKDYTGGQTFTFSMAITANTKLSGAAAATGGNTGGSGGSEPETPVNPPSGDETIEFTIITGKFITAEGGINTNANWNATDYITVYPNGKYTYYGNTAVGGGTTPAVYAYDANKTPIQALCTGIDGTNGYLFTTTADTAYIKLCSHKDTALKLEYTPNALEVAYVTNGYVSKTGEIATVSGWTRTEYIDVSDHRNINYLGTVPEGGLSTVAAIYGYDSAKAPIEMVLAPSTTEHVNGYVVTLTNDNIKYIVACAFTRNGEAFSITSAE